MISLWVATPSVALAQDTYLRAIYFVQDGNLYRVDANGQNKTLVREEVGTVGTMAIDSDDHQVYWSGGGRVQRVRLNGTDPQTVIEPGGIFFRGYFGFDPSLDHLYYFEQLNNDLSTTLYRHDIETGQRSIILRSGLGRFTGRVVIDWRQRRAYFGIDSVKAVGIDTLDQDDSDVSFLNDGNLDLHNFPPSFFALDIQRDLLYGAASDASDAFALARTNLQTFESERSGFDSSGFHTVGSVTAYLQPHPGQDDIYLALNSPLASTGPTISAGNLSCSLKAAIYSSWISWRMRLAILKRLR